MGRYGYSYNAFVPDPSKSQVVASMTGTKTFQPGEDGDVDITGWDVICVKPSADTKYYFNGESTKYRTIPADESEFIFVHQSNFTSVTFMFGTGTAEIQGM